jgi:glycerophosphoryl diester phosphodiesterase
MDRRDGRPLVIAHRGASATKAEHTLAAYVQALDEGAEGVECDVRLTADGHLVCVHDRKVNRVTNARGIVSTMTLEQLSALDVSTWKNPWADLDDEAVEPDREASQVLTLARLLEVVRDYDRRVEVAIETKHPTRYAGLVEQSLVELLKGVGWAGRGSPVQVMSFSGVALTRVRRLAPSVPVVLLIEGQSWKMTRAMLGTDWIAGPGVEELKRRRNLGRRLVEDGRRIRVWVVNTREDLDVCLRYGAEAVITDRPGHILSLLDSV